MSGPGDRDIERLREHFRARDLFERRQTSSFGKAGLDRLREEWRSSEGPNMKPCIANGKNAEIAFWVRAQKVRKKVRPGTVQLPFRIRRVYNPK